MISPLPQPPTHPEPLATGRLHPENIDWDIIVYRDTELFSTPLTSSPSPPHPHPAPPRPAPPARHWKDYKGNNETRIK